MAKMRSFLYIKMMMRVSITLKNFNLVYIKKLSIQLQIKVYQIVFIVKMIDINNFINKIIDKKVKYIYP